MVGRRSSAGLARRARTPSMSQIQWRRASATQMVEMEGLGIAGGNGFIDPHKAIEKLKLHGAGLWGMQIAVTLLMTTIAVIAGERVYLWNSFVSLTILFGASADYPEYIFLRNQLLRTKSCPRCVPTREHIASFNGIEPSRDRPPYIFVDP